MQSPYCACKSSKTFRFEKMEDLITVFSSKVVHLNQLVYSHFTFFSAPHFQADCFIWQGSKAMLPLRGWPSSTAVLYCLTNTENIGTSWLCLICLYLLQIVLWSAKKEGYCSEMNQIRKFPIAVVLIFKLVPPILPSFLYHITHTQLMIHLFGGDTMSLPHLAPGSWSCLEQRISSLKIGCNWYLNHPRRQTYGSN